MAIPENENNHSIFNTVRTHTVQLLTLIPGLCNLVTYILSDMQISARPWQRRQCASYEEEGQDSRVHMNDAHSHPLFLSNVDTYPYYVGYQQTFLYWYQYTGSQYGHVEVHSGVRLLRSAFCQAGR